MLFPIYRPPLVVRQEGQEPLPDHAGESTLLSRSGGDASLAQGLRWNKSDRASHHPFWAESKSCPAPTATSGFKHTYPFQTSSFKTVNICPFNRKCCLVTQLLSWRWFPRFPLILEVRNSKSLDISSLRLSRASLPALSSQLFGTCSVPATVQEALRQLCSRGFLSGSRGEVR